MSWGHIHTWKKEAITYAPKASLTKVDSCDHKTLEKLMLGVTTFVYRCTDDECGELKKIECLGEQIAEMSS